MFDGYSIEFNMRKKINFLIYFHKMYLYHLFYYLCILNCNRIKKRF